MENKKISFAGLKYILRKHEETGNSYCRNGWSIAKGGYDLWWEIYYKGYVVLQCIAGELCSDFSIPCKEFDEAAKKRLINKVKTEYKMK